MKLSVRIPLLIGIVVLITSAGLGAAALLISSRSLSGNNIASIKNEVKMNAEVIGMYINGELAVLQELANRARTRAMEWETLQPSIYGDIRRLGYLDMAVVYPGGNARYVLENNTSNLGDREYVKRAFEGKQVISDVLISRVTNQPVIMYAVPIWSDGTETNVAGVLVGRRDGVDVQHELLSMIRSSFNSGYGYLVGTTGAVAIHTDINLVLNEFNPIEEAKKNPSFKSLGDTISAGLRDKTGFSSYNYQGKALVCAYNELPGLNWTLFFSVERAEFTEGLIHLRYVLIAAGVLFVLAGIMVAALIGRSITRPINRLAATLKDISQGEGDLTCRISIQSKDEIADLAHYFNETIEKIKNLITTIKEKSTHLSEIGGELATNMGRSAEAVNQITGNIQNIKGRVINQNASVTQTGATMEQITANISSLNTHVERQTASVSQSSGAIEQMLANIQSVTQTLVNNVGNVHKLMEASSNGRNGLQEVSADIQEIARESEGLLEINAVMENISSQTNLLSMNAAIEAAHAGEAGKGFAVVSGEIRKLAESSSQQSKTIGAVLKKIKVSIDKITASTNNVLEKFEAIESSVQTVSDQEAIIRSAMEEQGEGSRQILEAISQLNEITGRVKDGSREMLEGSREVIGESRSLEAATAEITAGMNEMANGADDINTAVSRVTELSRQNRDHIGVLVEELSRFKIT